MIQTNCLIVDDSRLARMMLKKIFNEIFPDWHIVDVADGHQAIEAAQRENFQIIFLDFNMPNMDGGKVAKVLRPMLPNTRIALLTANIQESVKNLAAELKIDFIPKPITEDKISKYVRYPHS